MQLLQASEGRHSAQCLCLEQTNSLVSEIEIGAQVTEQIHERQIFYARIEDQPQPISSDSENVEGVDYFLFPSLLRHAATLSLSLSLIA
jgi:hypothetical protein